MKNVELSVKLAGAINKALKRYNFGTNFRGESAGYALGLLDPKIVGACIEAASKVVAAGSNVSAQKIAEVAWEVRQQMLRHEKLFNKPGYTAWPDNFSDVAHPNFTASCIKAAGDIVLTKTS